MIIRATLSVVSAIAVATIALLSPMAHASSDALQRARDHASTAEPEHRRFDLTYQADDTKLTAIIDTGREEGQRVNVTSSNVEKEDDYERMVGEMDRALMADLAVR